MHRCKPTALLLYSSNKRWHMSVECASSFNDFARTQAHLRVIARNSTSQCARARTWRNGSRTSCSSQMWFSAPRIRVSSVSSRRLRITACPPNKQPLRAVSQPPAHAVSNAAAPRDWVKMYMGWRVLDSERWSAGTPRAESGPGSRRCSRRRHRCSGGFSPAPPAQLVRHRPQHARSRRGRRRSGTRCGRGKRRAATTRPLGSTRPPWPPRAAGS